MIYFTDYKAISAEEKCLSDYSLTNKINEISISYDGGRLNIYINNEPVLSTLSAGDDFNLLINTKETI